VVGEKIAKFIVDLKDEAFLKDYDEVHCVGMQ